MRRTRLRFSTKKYISMFVLMLLILLVFAYSVLINRGIVEILLMIAALGIIGGFCAIITINHSESYVIKDDVIIIKRGASTTVIKIPEKCTLIISYADDGPGSIWINPIRSSLSINKEEYMVSIINSEDCNTIKKIIVESMLKQLSPEIIKRLFNEKYVYSFILDYGALNELLDQSNCTILLPGEIFTEIKDQIFMYNSEVY